MEERNADKLSFSQKVAYAFGSVAYNFIGNGIGLLALPIYSIGLGVSASLIGLALGIPRFLDALIDPYIGYLSDNTRSRWGRRRPYIILGGILAGLTFALLWNPGTDWSKNTLFGYFFAISMIYYIAFTVWSIPYGALGFELSNDYNERTNIQAYKMFLGSVFGFALPWLYKMCFWSWDKLIAPNGGHLIERYSALVQKSHVHGAEIIGARVVGIVFGIIIIITAIIPAICKENTSVQSQAKINFILAMKNTFKNKSFVIITTVGLLAFFGLFLVSPLALYINIYYVFNGNKEAAATMSGWAGTFYTLMGILSIPLATIISKRSGKKLAMMLGLGFTAFGYGLIWWFFTPAQPWLQLVPFIFIGPAWNCCMVVMPSMLADICDVDEIDTGLRREGTYSAIQCWVVKMGIGAVTCVTGVIVALAGIRPEAATQTATTVLKMRLMFVGLPVFFLLSAVVIMSFYPITEKKARDVRAILDARKEKSLEQVEPNLTH